LRGIAIYLAPSFYELYLRPFPIEGSYASLQAETPPSLLTERREEGGLWHPKKGRIGAFLLA
jgi:hypothetical protein